VRIFHFQALVCFCTLWALHCSSTIQEHEWRNNSATSAENLKPGHVLKGSYFSTTGTDADYIALPNEQADRWVKGTLSGVKGVDAEINILSADARTVIKTINDENSSIGEKFGPVFIPKGKAWLKISPLKPVNDEEHKKLFYEFSYNMYNAHADSEHEPNEEFKFANKITSDRITGYYSTIYHSIPVAGPKANEKDCFVKHYTEEKKTPPFG
jgi:hypothetical protein